jgi:membrane-bound lytic murein transglycosylase D
LYRQFGDWRLALAAYNAGEGRVQRLLDRHKTRSFDRIARHLPAETQMFVPKVEATLLRREGVELAKLSRPER